VFPVIVRPLLGRGSGLFSAFSVPVSLLAVVFALTLTLALVSSAAVVSLLLPVWQALRDL
jgi:hypothetical protein